MITDEMIVHWNYLQDLLSSIVMIISYFQLIGYESVLSATVVAK